MCTALIKNTIGSIFLLFFTLLLAWSLGLLATQDGHATGSPSNSLVATPTLTWNTFLGAAEYDFIGDIAVDGNGNIYVLGSSDSSWGTPQNPHTGGHDVFVAKLNSRGMVLWNTFMGSSGTDYGYGITLDTSGNVYVCGSSNATWGEPLNAFNIGSDAFIAKLNNSGLLQWHTFMGGGSDDSAHGISLDSSGNIYVSGMSYSSWGSPIFTYAGGADAFVAKLDSGGSYQWNTFLGTSLNDCGWGITVDGSNSIYATGTSGPSGGGAVNPHAGGTDAFAVKLDSDGELKWHTFMGCPETDIGYGIAIDTNGALYVTGQSDAGWGMPVNPYTEGGVEAFVAKLNSSSGTLQWHTFMGSADHDTSYRIETDDNNNVYVAGGSRSSWGNPVHQFSGDRDAFVAKLGDSGALQWHTFLGSASVDDYDWAFAIAVADNGSIFTAGESDTSWGTPISAYADKTDVFVARIDDSFPWVIFYPAFLERK